MRDLTKPQFEAAQEAARRLMQGSPNREADREHYREAVAQLCAVLPEDVDAKDVIRQVARWQMLNDIGAALVGLPVEVAA